MSTHLCHAYGCVNGVPPALLMCRQHWRMVPSKLQRLIWATYRPGQEKDKKPSPEYMLVQRGAIWSVFVQEGRCRWNDVPEVGSEAYMTGPSIGANPLSDQLHSGRDSGRCFAVAMFVISYGQRSMVCKTLIRRFDPDSRLQLSSPSKSLQIILILGAALLGSCMLSRLFEAALGPIRTAKAGRIPDGIPDGPSGRDSDARGSAGLLPFQGKDCACPRF